MQQRMLDESTLLDNSVSLLNENIALFVDLFYFRILIKVGILNQEVKSA